MARGLLAAIADSIRDKVVSLSVAPISQIIDWLDKVERSIGSYLVPEPGLMVPAKYVSVSDATHNPDSLFTS